MAVFKRARTNNAIAAEQKIKFGISFLDSILINLKQGSTILIEEDEYLLHHHTLLQIFMAQNISSEILAISNDHTHIKIPAYAAKQEMSSAELEKMLIAWRYSNTDVKKDEKKFDMKKQMSLEDKKIKFLFNVTPDEVLDLAIKQNDKSMICIFSLFSPAWRISSDFDFKSFYYNLKCILKRKSITAVITVPLFLHRFDKTRLYFDVVLSLKSFVFTNDFPNYDGILELNKNYILNEIVENNLDTKQFGLKSHRYGVVIERIVIPPEDADENTHGCSQVDLF